MSREGDLAGVLFGCWRNDLWTLLDDGRLDDEGDCEVGSAERLANSIW